MKYFRLRPLVLAAFVIVLGAGPIAVAATLTVGKADANASPLLPVNVGVQAGIFAKHGLEVKIADFTGGSKLMQAMTAGSVDIGFSAGPEMAHVAKGAPVLAVCDAMAPIPFIGIAVPWDSPVHTMAQLKGKKIGISSAGSLTNWLALELARTQGWGPDGITPVAIGNGATANIAAFRDHLIDANIAVTSNIFNMEEKKEGRLLIPVSKYESNLAAGTIYATNKVMASDPDAIRTFIVAWLDTIDYMRKHRAETIKIEGDVTGFSPTVMTKEYDLNIAAFSTDCKFDAELLATLKRSFADLKLLETPPDMTKLYTEAFLPK